MRYKVQLPDYPCHHIVTGLTEGRGESGRKLRLAEAQFVREGLPPTVVRDLVTLMVLHDAVAVRLAGDYRVNNPRLYGDRAGRDKAVSRITGALVESLPEGQHAS